MCGLHFVYTSFVPFSVVQSQSRKPSQFVSVCSLLVVSFLLSAVVEGQGELGDLGVSACVLGASDCA